MKDASFWTPVCPGVNPDDLSVNGNAHNEIDGTLVEILNLP